MNRPDPRGCKLKLCHLASGVSEEARVLSTISIVRETDFATLPAQLTSNSPSVAAIFEPVLSLGSGVGCAYTKR